jgi:hypothetical protein
MTAKSGAGSEEKGWTTTDGQSAMGLQVILLKRTYVFPWSQLLYAEGAGEEVRVAFATHDVIIKGHRLSLLLEDLAAQRVTQLREPSRSEKFASPSGPRIAELAVRKPDENP